MQSPQQSRIEQLIAITRVVMAVAALLAIWLDPSQPARLRAGSLRFINLLPRSCDSPSPHSMAGGCVTASLEIYHIHP